MWFVNIVFAICETQGIATVIVFLSIRKEGGVVQGFKKGGTMTFVGGERRIIKKGGIGKYKRR